MSVGSKPEQVLTLKEAAEKYRMSPRALREFCKRHKIEVLSTGTQIRFDAHAINQLEKVMRTCHTNSTSERAPSTTISATTTPTEKATEFANVRRLMTARRRNWKD